MGEEREKVKFLVINLIRGLLALAFISSIYYGRNLVMVFSLIGFVATFVPKVLKTLGVNFPAIYEIIIILSIYGILFLSEVRGFFAEFWWWDIALNLIAASVLGIVGLIILYALYRDRKIKANPLIISFLTFCFTIAVGVLWEIIEFSIDNLFGFKMQKSNIDTMKDIITNTFGAFIISLIGYSYIQNGEIKIISKFVSKQIERYKRFFRIRNTLEESSDEIKKIISVGESKNLEFKSTLRTNLHTNEIDSKIEYSTIKTISAFLNTEGGTLLIGVNDNGKICGLEKDNFKDNDSLNLHFTNLLKKYIGNEYLHFIEFELFPVDDKHVLKIECQKSKKPVFVKFQNEEEFYIRNGPASVKLSAREMVEYIEHHFRTE
ncbi:MAG: ATP-binding protein [Candidatus Pacearchaeota archaeon]